MNTLLGIQLDGLSKKDILEKIEKYMKSPNGFFHIVSINPENMVIAQTDKLFREIVRTAQIRILDGIGTVIAGQILNIEVGSRYPGADLMQDMVKRASERRMTVMFIGGKGNLAERVANCYSQQYSEAKFYGTEGIKDIENPQIEEEKKTFSIVADIKPRMIFVSFGSPYQEKWIWKNRALLQGVLVMGVGGAFEFVAGDVARAPRVVRSIGLEWLYRLFAQPWRIQRQLRLPYFLYLVFKQKLGLYKLI